jgi:hopanoid biosynthesis associated protein HpnK
MASPERPLRRLVVNADDFGRSADINAAVIRAHTDGILTTASLMVAEPAAAEAVALARAHPRLGVGLHLVLVCGRPVLPARDLPGLVTSDGRFLTSAVQAGLRFFFRRRLREGLAREIAAQFEAFARTGLTLDHVNGHLNFHLHPVVFRLLLDAASARGVRHLRLTRDAFRLNARLAAGAWAYRLSHAIIFHLLSAWARPQLRRAGVRHTQRVFGLLQNGRVDTAFLEGLLPRLPAGDSELYSHPSLTTFRTEFEALVSPSVKTIIAREHIQLRRYQDL